MFSLRDRKSPREETAKLTAAYVNGLAIGLTIVGGIGPIINVVVPNASSLSAASILLLMPVGCMGGSVALHLCARAYLKRELSR